LPALILPVAWMFLRRSLPLPPWRPLAVVAALAVLGGILIPDLITNQRYALAAPAERWLIVLVSANLVFAAWWLGSARGALLPVGVLVVSSALFAAQSLHSYRANVSPMYPVTDTAEFKASASEIDRVTGPGDVVVVSKDTGYYVPEARIIEGQDALVQGDEHVARILREVKRVKVVSADSFGPPYGPASLSAIDECFRDVRPFGSAYVRVRTGC
jgi:hypothetical protein